jgi:uncharacterized protein (DUF58 family)
MPTTRGWAAIGAALALVVLWVAFGEELLLAVAAFLLLSVVVAIVSVRRGIPRVAFDRRISPTQVHDGDRAVVEAVLDTERRLSQAVIEDVVHGLGSAQFVAERVDPAAPASGRYEILCRPRGVYRVGPASVMVRDFLAMAESGGLTGRADRLVVYPRIDELVGLPIVRGQDPTVNTSRASFSQTSGEDFFTLREYQRGDDLRKVHWPTSAKRDELMIKQLEMPWQSRALILLDPRPTTYLGTDGFEHAVRGTASALKHLFRAGFSPTLWVGSEQPVIAGTAEGFAMAMEHLATLQPSEALDLRAAVARLKRNTMAGGALVLVTGSPDEAILAVYRMLATDYSRTLVMCVARTANDALQSLKRAGAVTMRAETGTSWSSAWREAMERAWSSATAG